MKSIIQFCNSSKYLLQNPTMATKNYG